MPARGKIRRPTHVTVGDFFSRHGDDLELKLLGSDAGFERKISEPTINRPGLALAGFFTYFAYKRVQVLGNSELSYLNGANKGARKSFFGEMCRRDVPCLVVSRGKALPKDLMKVAEDEGLSVFQSPMITMKFVNAATIALEMDFAPSCSKHGSMIDVQGIGVLICGASGSGKSETVLGLLRRGSSLVADDLVHLQAFEGRELIARAPEMGFGHMEVRGIGLINVSAMFGVGAIRLRKRLDMVIELRPAAELNSLERVGVEVQTTDIMGIDVPVIKLPVAAGRDLAQLVEVAALDQKLKSLGHDTAVEFNKKLLNLLDDGTIY